jgi:4-hydroxybenzoate polyprenyltransferase
MRHLLTSLRPKQWIKNLVVFAGLFFSHNLADTALVAKAAAAFAIFCLLSSSIYLINDVRDRELDARHPVKRMRPIASGQLSALRALSAAAALSAFALAASFRVGLMFGLAAAAYFGLMLAYIFWLKRIVLLDIFAIAAGFVLRAVAGAVAVSVPISEWLLICVSVLSLFLVFTKRRQEATLEATTAGGPRPGLSEYTPVLLDQMISIVAAATIVCYCLYTLSPETVAKFGSKHLVYTVPFVMYGVFRYLFLIYKRQTKESPEVVLLADPWLLGDVLLYALVSWYVVYR